MAESNKPEAATGAEKGARKRGLWDRLTPAQKKMAVFGGATAIIFGFFTLMNGNIQISRSRTKPIENVLTDRSSKELGLDSLTAQIKIANDNMTQMRAENRQLRKQVEDLHGQVEGTIFRRVWQPLPSFGRLGCNWAGSYLSAYRENVFPVFSAWPKSVSACVLIAFGCIRF